MQSLVTSTHTPQTNRNQFMCRQQICWFLQFEFGANKTLHIVKYSTTSCEFTSHRFHRSNKKKNKKRRKIVIVSLMQISNSIHGNFTHSPLLCRVMRFFPLLFTSASLLFFFSITNQWVQLSETRFYSTQSQCIRCYCTFRMEIMRVVRRVLCVAYAIRSTLCRWWLRCVRNFTYKRDQHID